MKFLDWIKDKIWETKEVVLTGATPLTLNDTVYVDLLGYVLGRRLDTSRGHIDYNFTEGTLDFDDTADTTNNNDAVVILFQLDHRAFRGTGATLRPHIHFIDDDISNKPAWKAQFKIEGRGSYAGISWKDMDATKFVHRVNNTVNGREEILSLEEISIDGAPLSGQIKVRLWRDGSKDSAPTKVKVSFIDAHIPIYKLGSQDEFVQ